MEFSGLGSREHYENIVLGDALKLRRDHKVTRIFRSATQRQFSAYSCHTMDRK